MIAGPKKQDRYDDIILDCQEAMELEFQMLAESAVQAGWNQYDVAVALYELACARVLELRANKETMDAIARANRKN